MSHRLHRSIFRWLLAAVVLILSGCASGPRERYGTVHTTMFGIAGEHFLRIDPATGVATSLASSPDLEDSGALTYDPVSRTFYAVGHSSSDPQLIAIARDRLEIRKIGSIDLPNLSLTLVEGLAYDPFEKVLYASGGRSSFASDRLLSIDVATGVADEVGKFQGTAQNDIDALIVIGHQLYGVDSIGSASAIYEIDRQSMQTTLQVQSFPKVVTDLTFDAGSRRMVATVDKKNLLLALSPDGQTNELGPTHAADDFGGSPISALSTGEVAADLFEDNFESGDFSLWIPRMKTRKKKPSPPPAATQEEAAEDQEDDQGDGEGR